MMVSGSFHDWGFIRLQLEGERVTQKYGPREKSADTLKNINFQHTMKTLFLTHKIST